MYNISPSPLPCYCYIFWCPARQVATWCVYHPPCVTSRRSLIGGHDEPLLPTLSSAPQSAPPWYQHYQRHIGSRFFAVAGSPSFDEDDVAAVATNRPVISSTVVREMWIATWCLSFVLFSCPDRQYVCVFGDATSQQLNVTSEQPGKSETILNISYLQNIRTTQKLIILSCP